MEFFRFKRDLPLMKYALYFNAISLITFTHRGRRPFHQGPALRHRLPAAPWSSVLRMPGFTDMAQRGDRRLKTGEAVVQNLARRRMLVFAAGYRHHQHQMSENLFKAVCGARTISDTKTRAAMALETSRASNSSARRWRGAVRERRAGLSP